MVPTPRIVQPPHELDPSTAAALDAALGIYDAEEHCVVDFAAVTFCDSSGLRVLITHCLRHLEAGSDLHVINISAALRRVFTRAGVAVMFGLDEH